MDVVGLWRYPVKSMRGERVDRLEVGEAGAEGDRRWGVVDRAAGRVLSAKREPRLLEAAARLDGEAVVVELPSGEVLEAGDPALDAAVSSWLGRELVVERADPGRPRSYDMHVAADDESSAVITIPTPPGTFLDAAPLHLLTTASLAAMAERRPDSRWEVDRFRPTVLVAAEGADFVEDAWIGGGVAVGAVEASVFAPTVRCTLTARAQAGLPRDVGVPRGVLAEHAGNLGVYAVVAAAGTIEVGDTVAPA